MSKYADIEQIKKVIRDEWIKYIPMELDMNIAFVLGKVAEVPTVEIVRCKNCKHWGGVILGNKCTMLSGLDYVIATKENDYCSFAERKGGDTE